MDQNDIFRVHKLKGHKIMADKNFNAAESDFEEIYKIKNLKQAT